MGSITKMGKRQAVSVDDFYDLLDNWFKTTNEPTVGDIINNPRVSPWVWVVAGGHACRLHADASREGIARLLRPVGVFERDRQGHTGLPGFVGISSARWHFFGHEHVSGGQVRDVEGVTCVNGACHLRIHELGLE